MVDDMLKRWGSWRQGASSCILPITDWEMGKLVGLIDAMEEIYESSGCSLTPDDDPCLNVAKFINDLEYLKGLVKCSLLYRQEFNSESHPSSMDDLFYAEIGPLPGKIDKRVYMGGSFRDWLARVNELWNSLSPKAARMAAMNQILMNNVEAINYQLQYLDRQGAEKYQWWLDETLNQKVRGWFYHVPRLDSSIQFNPLYVERALQWWNDTDNVIKAELTANKLNDVINKRTSYGLRGELADAPGHMLGWSNEGRFWRSYARRYKKGEELKLDANEIFAPIDDEDLLEQTRWLLDPLPLYPASIEAKVKGHVSWEEADRIWNELQSARLAAEDYREFHKQAAPEDLEGLKWYEVCRHIDKHPSRRPVKRVRKEDQFGVYYECPVCGSQLYPGGLGVL